MKCKFCNNGKVTITAAILTDNGFKEESPIEIDCIWCNGTGELTASQVQKLQDLEDAWCKCGNPSGQVSYYQHGHFHGYNCADCGKIVQTG